ncbi:hypothetical protein [Brevundimonas sp.]|uniref:hypothetical protein n=1 Tax=Brevundimonas sp. TaxID=1871086 RepID=UPI003F71876F
MAAFDPLQTLALTPTRPQFTVPGRAIDGLISTRSKGAEMMITRVSRDEIFLLFAITESANALGAIEEIRELAAVREHVPPEVERRENRSVFRAIRVALQAAANVSKVFWPQGSSGEMGRLRAERLRNLTGLPERHGLSNRALRNHIEHMDERLDDWTAADPRPFLGFELVVHADYKESPEMHALAVEGSAIVYDAEIDEVQLFGGRFPLAQLHADVVAVQEAASKGMAVLGANMRAAEDEAILSSEG